MSATIRCAGAENRPACGWQGRAAIVRTRVEAGATMISYHCPRCDGQVVLMLPAVAS